MEYLANIFIISAFCAGLQQASLQGMVLNSLREILYRKMWGAKYLLPYLYTILIGCIFCMASLWGTLLYWILQVYVWAFEVDLSTWIMWPITCVCCVFLNGFLFFVMKYVEEKVNH